MQQAVLHLVLYCMARVVVASVVVLRAVQTPRVAGLPWALGLGFAADADAGAAVAVAVVDTVTGAATEAVVEVVGSALAVVDDVEAAEAGLVETVMVVMVEVVLLVLVLVLVLLLDALAAVVFAGSGPVAVEDQRRMERYMS